MNVRVALDGDGAQFSRLSRASVMDILAPHRISNVEELRKSNALIFAAAQPTYHLHRKEPAPRYRPQERTSE